MYWHTIRCQTFLSQSACTCQSMSKGYTDEATKSDVYSAAHQRRQSDNGNITKKAQFDHI